MNLSLAQQLTPIFWIATAGFLGWGLYRARNRGKVATWIWLQTLMLILPWVIFLGLLTFSVVINLAGLILLLLVFTVIYIVLGQKVRQLKAQEWESNRSHQSPEITADQKSEQMDAPTLDPNSVYTGMDLDDFKAVTRIFSLDSFFVTETIPYNEGVIFKGNLRSDPAEALAHLNERLTAALGDRYQLFLLEDQQQRPTVVVLPRATTDQKTRPEAKFFAGILAIASMLTTLEIGANLWGFSLFNTPSRWLQALPFVLGVIGILLLHELGHRWMADRYGVKLSPPFFIPSVGIGTLGTLNRLETPTPTRKALFDIAIAGPVVSGLLSLAILLLGLWLSPTQGSIPLSSNFFQSSILVGTLTHTFLDDQLLSGVVLVHPLVAVGWISLAITALSLLPAGQLDGGRIVQAVYGRKTAARTTFVTLIVLGIGAITNPLALYWALLILFIAREPERPPMNEISETDEGRDALALLSLFFMALTLLPVPPGLAKVLHLLQ
ncbi:MAG: site-2 protease family protein [Synechococcaceae cyanobacterium SM2_3_1]|nr:site-2 protease family protein [Synechococcaceae cyanobacterium SM2_3_1]